MEWIKGWKCWVRWFRLTVVYSFCSPVLPTRSEVRGSFVKLRPSTLRFTRKQCVLLTCWFWLVIICQGPLFHLVLQMGICFGTEEPGVLFELRNASAWLDTLLAVVGAQPFPQLPSSATSAWSCLPGHHLPDQDLQVNVRLWLQRTPGLAAEGVALPKCCRGGCAVESICSPG